MTSKPIEVVRRFVELYNRRDVDRLLEIVHPEVEAVSLFAGLEAGGVHRGHAEFPGRYFEAIDQIFSEFRIVARDFVDLGHTVCICCDFEGRAADSGAEMSEPMYVVWQLRDGRLYRGYTFRTKREGLEKLLELERG